MTTETVRDPVEGAEGTTEFRGRDAIEREVADLIGIPYDTHMQAGLFPVAYTLGDDFARAARAPVTDVATWNAY